MTQTNLVTQLAAARRRAAEFVPEWRQSGFCSHTKGQRCDICGWQPGVKGADGAGYDEISPDELLLAALNAFNAAMEARNDA